MNGGTPFIGDSVGRFGVSRLGKLLQAKRADEIVSEAWPDAGICWLAGTGEEVCSYGDDGASAFKLVARARIMVLSARNEQSNAVFSWI